jgi:hypothetical protein
MQNGDVFLLSEVERYMVNNNDDIWPVIDGTCPFVFRIIKIIEHKSDYISLIADTNIGGLRLFGNSFELYDEYDGDFSKYHDQCYYGRILMITINRSYEGYTLLYKINNSSYHKIKKEYQMLLSFLFSDQI